MSKSIKNIFGEPIYPPRKLKIINIHIETERGYMEEWDELVDRKKIHLARWNFGRQFKVTEYDNGEIKREVI